MSKVCLEITYSRRRVLWTEPMTNLRAVEALSRHLAQKKHFPRQVQVWDDAGHLAVAEACFAIAEQEGDVIEYEFGPRLASGPRRAGKQHGRRQYRVRLAPLPEASGLLPVVGGFPLLELAPPAGDSEPVNEQRAGVLASDSRLDVLEEELEAQPATIAIRLRPAAPQSWFDRLLGWLLGEEMPEQRRP